MKESRKKKKRAFRSQGSHDYLNLHSRSGVRRITKISTQPNVKFILFKCLQIASFFFLVQPTSSKPKDIHLTITSDKEKPAAISWLTDKSINRKLIWHQFDNWSSLITKKPIFTGSSCPMWGFAAFLCLKWLWTEHLWFWAVLNVPVLALRKSKDIFLTNTLKNRRINQENNRLLQPWSNPRNSEPGTRKYFTLLLYKWKKMSRLSKL